MVAALILPPSPACLDLPPEVRERVLTSWAAWWEPLRDSLKPEPPTEESEEERAVLVAFVRGTATVSTQLGATLLPLLQSGLHQALFELVRREDAAAPTERRLGLRYLERAVETLSDLFDVFRQYPPDGFTSALSRLSELTDHEVLTLLDPASVALLRLELSVFVAFDLVAADPIDAFVRWARHAKTAASRAAPFVTQLVAFAPRAPASELSPDVVLSAQAFERVTELLEAPPAPSTRLRELVRRGTA